MNWIEALQHAIQYMESHLDQKIDCKEIARGTGYAPGYLQKGFSMITGLTFADYVRLRRLYQAAIQLKNEPDYSITEAALDYGYESSESFSRAFRQFHGLSPVYLRKSDAPIKVFLPLHIQISVQGGNEMDVKMQTIPGFTLIGYNYRISNGQDSYQIIPQLWNEFMQDCTDILKRQKPEKEKEKAIWENNVGEYGVCRMTEEGLEYFIGGKYQGGQVPEGTELLEVPALQWGLFDCYGPLPDSLQSVNTRIFKEWLPLNPQWKMSEGINIEWYSMDDNHCKYYHSQIWIPLVSKESRKKP